jgi:uncharacterized protein (TIGR02246 family)
MNADESEIRELVTRWMAASKAGDLTTVLSLMTDDVVFLVAGQQPFGKQQFAAAMQPGAAGAAMPRIDGRNEIQEIRIFGDFAYMWTRLTVEVTPPGDMTMKRAGHTLSVLRKEGGRWRLARDANLLSPVSV